MTSVGERFSAERARVSHLLNVYESLGPVGSFGAAVLREALAEADAAVASGDVVRIVQAFAALQDRQ